MFIKEEDKGVVGVQTIDPKLVQHNVVPLSRHRVGTQTTQ